MGIRTERTEADLAVPFIIYITLLLVIVFPIGGVQFRYARILLSRMVPINNNVLTSCWIHCH